MGRKGDTLYRFLRSEQIIINYEEIYLMGIQDPED
jgi:hypothetical protein